MTATTEARHARDVALAAKAAAEARDEALALLGTCPVDLRATQDALAAAGRPGMTLSRARDVLRRSQATQDALAAAGKARDDALALLATCSDDLKAAQDVLTAAEKAPDTALAQIATCSDDLRAAEDALAAALKAALAIAETGRPKRRRRLSELVRTPGDALTPHLLSQ